MLTRNGIRQAALLFAAVGSLSCGSDASSSTSPSSGSFQGTYPLYIANFNTIPALLYQDATLKEEVTGGQVVVDNNYKCAMTVRFRVTRNGSVTTPQWSAGGTYSIGKVLDQTFADCTLPGADAFGDITFSAMAGSPITVDGTVPRSVITDVNGGEIGVLLLFNR